MHAGSRDAASSLEPESESGPPSSTASSAATPYPYPYPSPSASGTEPGLEPGLEQTPSSPGTTIAVVPVRRRPIPRKGHTKSRRGCLNCKRRKVKCPETMPACSNCTRIGLTCEYPHLNPSSLPVSSAASLFFLSSPSAPLQSTPTLFNSMDMRFFHHFLLAAYPPLPIQGDDIWREVAALSHSYDYLMHAMLGLGASHLAIYGGNCAAHALAHRVKAIQSLNQALSTPPRSAAEGDARYGAMFALTFQASCMPDGMNEFLSMIKGCHVIATSSMLAYEDSLFGCFTQQGYGDSVRRVIGSTPIVLDDAQEVMLDEFLASLRALVPLCTSPLEIKFLASTEHIVTVARISAAEAFAQFATHYSLVTHASKEEFDPFTDPHHYPAQLLLIHFILIEFAIGHIALGPVGRRFAFREKSCIAWMRRLADSLPEQYKKYAEWPMKFVDNDLEP
ncbi:hypothetical protein C8A05DRAFT_31445 [Staphylotrichum tortipilum]|uniref:Zn(2)-C6 fungal-type domain-containing protein n=1 Tax=Staphylotrichum tortipilum TaxID=2831512 RepID=A0AAN6RW82_9PEZI|nr:hypothetical protein C8A05DRAFT_31445 [Staphylotrichum longicolle]